MIKENRREETNYYEIWRNARTMWDKKWEKEEMRVGKQKTTKEEKQRIDDKKTKKRQRRGEETQLNERRLDKGPTETRWAVKAIEKRIEETTWDKLRRDLWRDKKRRRTGDELTEENRREKERRGEDKNRGEETIQDERR